MLKFGTGTASLCVIPKPAPRIPGDPLGVVPVVCGSTSSRCMTCAIVEHHDACDSAPCYPYQRPGMEVIHYIRLAETIARGIVRHSWSDV